MYIINELLFRIRQPFKKKSQCERYLSNYGTRKELKHVAGIDTSNLAIKSAFIALKAKVDKFDILKFVDVLTSVNYLKTNADDLDVSTIKDSYRFEKIKRCSG